jgi:hypothetical protein
LTVRVRIGDAGTPGSDSQCPALDQTRSLFVTNLRVVAILSFVAVAAVLAVVLMRSPGVGANSASVQVAIDTDTTGNSANALGPTEACNAAPLQVGDTINVDVVVKGVPQFHAEPSPGDGIQGFGFNLLFDPQILQVDAVHIPDGPTIVAASGNASLTYTVDYDYSTEQIDGPPGTTGDVRVDVADLNPHYEAGDGVLARVTLRARAVGASRVDLRSGRTTVYDAASQARAYPADVSNATIVVGSGSCESTPAAFPTPSRGPSFTTGPPLGTPSSIATLDVAIDTDVSSNSDNKLGPTDVCNTTRLKVGDTMDVDIVVRGVPPFDPTTYTNGIGAYGTNLLFDPAILQVSKVQTFDGPTILKAGGTPIPFVILDYAYNPSPSGVDSVRNDPPGTTGDTRIDVVDLSQHYESGDGVLTRVTLQAVGSGKSRLDLTDLITRNPEPQILMAGSFQYKVRHSSATAIVGDGSCSAPTPGPIPTPQLITATPYGPPAGFAKVRIEPARIGLGVDTEITVTANSFGPPIGTYSLDFSVDPTALKIVSCSTSSNCSYSADKNDLRISGFNKEPSRTGILGSFTVRAIALESKLGPLTATSATLRDTNDAAMFTDLPLGKQLLTVFVAAPTPTATPSAGAGCTCTSVPAGTLAIPASLPQAGGEPAPAGDTVEVVLVALGALLLFGVSFVFAARRRA